MKAVYEKQHRLLNTATSTATNTALSTPMYSFSDSDTDSPGSSKRNAELRRIESIPEDNPSSPDELAEEIEEDIRTTGGHGAFQENSEGAIAEEIDDEIFE